MAEDAYRRRERWGSRGESGDEVRGRYASRQCKIMYRLCWRNRHRSAPATSGLGRHVKSGSCDMPLRSAAGSAQELRTGGGRASVRRAVWSRAALGGRDGREARVRRTKDEDPRDRQRARGSGEQHSSSGRMGCGRGGSCLRAEQAVLVVGGGDTGLWRMGGGTPC